MPAAGVMMPEISWKREVPGPVAAAGSPVVSVRGDGGAGLEEEVLERDVVTGRWWLEWKGDGE